MAFMRIRFDPAAFADHDSVSEAPSALAQSADSVQSTAASAIRPDTFFGPVDRASDDTQRFSEAAGVAALPPVKNRSGETPRRRIRMEIHPQDTVVLGDRSAISDLTRKIEKPSSHTGRPVVEREGGVSTAHPLRYGLKAMHVSLHMSQAYMKTMVENQMRRKFETQQLRDKLQHILSWFSVPEMVFLVNPTELNWQLVNKVQETRTRGGFFQEYWPSELDTLTASGQTAVAYVVGGDRGRGKQGGGLTIRDLRASAGYRNIRRLVDIYRSNGVIYGMRGMGNYGVGNDLERPIYRKTLLHNGFVAIFYDGVTYKGYFENFEIREAGDMPYWLTWNFTFKVESYTGHDLLMYDTGKFMGRRGSDGAFESRSHNTTGQRNT